VLHNLTPVLRDLSARHRQFDATVVEFRRLMHGLARQRGQFADTIDHLGAMVSSTSDLLDRARGPLDRDVAGLRRTAALLAAERGRLPTTVDRLPLVLGAFGRSMSYGAYLNVHLCNLGFTTPVGAFWVGGDEGPYSGACRG